jgi:hypothetical protein
MLRGFEGWGVADSKTLVSAELIVNSKLLCRFDDSSFEILSCNGIDRCHMQTRESPRTGGTI